MPQTELNVCTECLDHGGRHFHYCSQNRNNRERRAREAKRENDR